MMVQSFKKTKTIKDFKDLNEFLRSRHVEVDKLRFYLKNVLKKPVPNNKHKEQIIRDILYKLKVDPIQLIKSLFNQEELSDICKKLDRPHAGTKTTLSERILERLPVAIDKSKKQIPLKTYIFEQLEKLYLLEEEIKSKGKFLGAFKGAIHNNVRKTVVITPQDQFNHHLVLKFEEKEQVVFVSAWFVQRITQNKRNGSRNSGLIEDTNRIMANILRDQRDFQEEMIYYVYDSSTQVNNDDLELITTRIKTVHKAPGDFVR